MNIVMIGASGFVGTSLIRLLSEEPDNYSITNIDLQHSHFFDKLTKIGDVRDSAFIDNALKDADLVILLAAQHRDDVYPVSEYYTTNVDGMKITLDAMAKNGVKRLIFFSSVAIYGLNKDNPNETHPADPFNHYGKSKWEAEKIVQAYYKDHPDWNIDILRPTVIFGERNRGNVYNLLNMIQSGKFLMVGNGKNRKSMAYIGNIVAFVKYLIDTNPKGYNVYNYIDKPDKEMNDLVGIVSQVLNRHIPAVHFPYWLGMTGGKCFDLLAKITGKKLTISSVRIKKFCATTVFDSSKAQATGFEPPYTLDEGLRRTLEYEFIHPRPDEITYKTE